MDITSIEESLTVLKNGGLILYPTDTIWGLGCDATNPEAVEKIYKLKNRPADKSLIILLDSENKLQNYVREVPDVAYQLIEYAEKPLTIIYPNAINLPENLVGNDKSIGIRIVKHPFCERLLQRLRKPIVSTSANSSGFPSPRTFAEVDDVIKGGVDYIVPFGQEDTQENQASTIIKLGTSGQYELIRK